MIYAVKQKWDKKSKTLCIIRYGAWGDAIMLSPVFKYFKQEGWYITLNCTQKCFDILNTNPNIDAFLLQDDGEIPFENLDKHWKELNKKFDRVINFTGSIENSLLIAQNQPEWNWSKDQRHERCNVNYYDHTMKLAGFPDKTGEIGELHFKAAEERWAATVRKRYPGFLVVWCLSGSAIHKIYPYADVVIQALVSAIPEATVILVGEQATKGIIDPHPRIMDWCGRFNIRKSFILTKIADLVVSPETSVLAASGCFNTPKIALLSHGSEVNVTKYYKNCYSVRQDVSCSPCHKLHFSRETCPLVKETQFPVCMGLLDPKKLLQPIEEIYNKWKTT